MTRKHKSNTASDFEKVARRTSALVALLDALSGDTAKPVKAKKPAKSADENFADGLIKASDRLTKMIEKENRRREKSP